MTIYTYSYGITSSFPNQIYSESSLYSEVQNSSITVGLHSIDADFVYVYFNFKANLSPIEITTLNNIVATHTGAELAPNAIVDQGVSGSVPWNIQLVQTQTTQSVSGTITVDNFPSIQTVSVSNPVSSVIVSNLPGTQTVSPQTGSVFAVTGNLNATVSFPATQSVQIVSGSSAISQGNPLWITGSVFQINQAVGTQTVAGTVTVTQGNASATQNWRVFLSGSNFASNGLVTYITGSNYTQTVSVSNPVSSVTVLNPVSSVTVAPQTGSVFTVTGNLGATVTFPATQSVQIVSSLITQSIQGAVTVGNFPATQTVSVSNPVNSVTVLNPISSVTVAPQTGSSFTVSVSNPVSSVNVNNFPSTQTVSVSNPVSSVVVSNLPGTQTVSPQTGSVFTVTGNVGTTVTFPTTQSVQIVSSLITQSVQGTINVGNFPSTQTVSVSNPVSSVAVSNFPGTQTIAPQTGSVFTITGTVASTAIFPATQSVQLVSGSSAISQGNPLWVTGSVQALPTGVQTITGSVIIGGQPVTMKDYEVATFSVLALNTSIGNAKSMISIVNGAGSGVTIKIRSIKVINTQNTAVAGIVSDFRILRITGHSVGTLLSPQTFDTEDSLNANVTVRTGATVAGASATPLLRYEWSSDDWAAGTLDLEAQDHAFQNTIPIYQHFPGRKPITLREGEGLHILHNVNSNAGSFDIDVIFTQE